MHSRAHVFVSGRVQGVSFRFFTASSARQLGLKGWVRNLQDGRVEAVFEGNKPAIEQAIEAVRKGSQSSRVDDVSVEWEEPRGEESFVIRG